MEPRIFLGMVFFDVASACNLACPFCVFDWRTIKKATLAPPQILDKVFGLAPHVNNGALSLSCAHEPTMHPRLSEILDGIKDNIRPKFFMTTNMTNKMSDELIASIAGCGINHINISVDTLDEDTFRVLRRGGELSAFRANMDRLSKQLDRTGRLNAPKFRFITMGFKSNYHEMSEILDYGKAFGVDQHEIRYLFDVEHISESFKVQHVLEEEHWMALAHLARGKGNVFVYPPPNGYKYKFQADEGYVAPVGAASLATSEVLMAGVSELDFEPPELERMTLEVPLGPKKSAEYLQKTYAIPRTVNGSVPPFPLVKPRPTLHISSDGSMTISEWGRDRFEINLMSIRDPAMFLDAIIQR